MTPRILYVDHTAALGGAELYLLDIVRYQRRTACVVVFEEGLFPERLRLSDVPVKVIKASPSLMGVTRDGKKWTAVFTIPEIFRMARKVAALASEYDVIYANSQKALFVAAFAGRMARKPVVWNLHDIITSDHFGGANRKAAVFLANHFVDTVIVNSEATRAAFEKSGGRTETRIVYNGIESELFTGVHPHEIAMLRQQWGAGEAPVIGVFSRLTHWKGQDVMVKALADLPGVHLLMVGGALFQDDGQYEIMLRSMVRQLDMEDRVHFLGFRDDVPRLMQAVDVVVHTSRSAEPFGRVIVEGMMAGKPVIATGAGGAKEIIREFETGWLVPPGNAPALAATVQRILNDPVATEVIAKAGQDDVRARFSVDKTVQDIEDQVRRIAGIDHGTEHTEATPATA